MHKKIAQSPPQCAGDCPCAWPVSGSQFGSVRIVASAWVWFCGSSVWTI